MPISRPILYALLLALGVYAVHIAVVPFYDFDLFEVPTWKYEHTVIPVIRPYERSPKYSLYLSGGGYRALLFHVGSLWRLNESGQLKNLDRIVGVSGGAIASAALGARWSELQFASDGVAINFQEKIVEPLLGLTATTIDIPAVVFGVLSAESVPQRLAAYYDRYIFHGMRLSAMPYDPQFVFQATSIRSGKAIGFSNGGVWSQENGLSIKNPDLRMSEVVTASSGFPPFLGPSVFRLYPVSVAAREILPDTVYWPDDYDTSYLYAVDGGVADNLGAASPLDEEISLISDAARRPDFLEEPRKNWISTVLQAMDLMMDQPRDLTLKNRHCRSQLKPPYKLPAVVYWSSEMPLDNLGLRCPAGPADMIVTRGLAALPTRLAALPERTQKQLINWGYNTALISLEYHQLSPPGGAAKLPYPEFPLTRDGQEPEPYRYCKAGIS